MTTFIKVVFLDQPLVWDECADMLKRAEELIDRPDVTASQLRAAAISYSVVIQSLSMAAQACLENAIDIQKSDNLPIPLKNKITKVYEFRIGQEIQWSESIYTVTYFPTRQMICLDTKLPAVGDPSGMKTSIADFRKDFESGKAKFHLQVRGNPPPAGEKED